MRLYLLPVMGICFAVDGLLLGAAGALAGRRIRWENAAIAAALGALYAGACLLPKLQYLGSFGWRVGVLLMMGALAFGAREWGSTALFVVLDLACGAMALAMEGPGGILLSGLTVTVLVATGVRSKRGLVPVELCWEDKRERVIALRDTGNGLCDPVTGEPVLVVGPEIAGKLVGLSRLELKSPVETLAKRKLPGLRLIPYTAVGGKGLMLALRLPCVRIGHIERSTLVAFAAEGLNGKGGFEALTGGAA